MSRRAIIPGLVLVLLLIAMLAGVLFGTAEATWADRIAALMRAEAAPRSLGLILWEWRMPRVIAVALAMAAEMRAPMCGRRVGAALRADSGCVLYRMCGAVCDVHEKEHQLPAV